MAIDETRREHLGTFETEILAAQAFDTRARTLGRSSECNFDEETQPRIPNEDLSYDKTQGQPADKSIPPPPGLLRPASAAAVTGRQRKSRMGARRSVSDSTKRGLVTGGGHNSEQAANSLILAE